MFQIELSETPETAVKRIATERLDTTINLLSNPNEDFDKAIHTSRKNLKRIRAVLRLIRGEIGDETYRVENIGYRDAGRRLAPLRDSAVMVMTLDATREHIEQNDAFAATRAQLTARHEQIRRQFIAESDRLTEVIATLKKGRERFLALPISSAGFATFAAGLHRIYRQGQRMMAQAYVDPQANPALFHNWRKRVKYLWYHLEILEPLWSPVFRAWVRELHHISDLLGDAHDLVVLADLLQTEPAQFSAEQELRELLPLLHNRRRELEMRARPYGRRLFAEKPNAFVSRIRVLWDVWQATGIGGLPPKPPTFNEDDLVSVREAGQLLGLSPRQVRQKIYDGRLPAIKVGRIWVIPRTAVTNLTP